MKEVSGKTQNLQINTRSSHPEVFYQKKDVLKNFAKFAEKHFCRSLFFNKVAGQKLETFRSSHWRFSVKQGVLKKLTPTKVFPCEFCELFKKTQKVFKRLVLKHHSGGVSSISKPGDLKLFNSIRKRLQHRYFFVNVLGKRFCRTPSNHISYDVVFPFCRSVKFAA